MIRLVYAMTTIGVLLLAAGTSIGEVICSEPRLGRLRCVCGSVTDQSGAPVPGATVEVLVQGAAFATRQTGEDGRFSFDEIKAGKYELRFQAYGFLVSRFAIVLGKPAKKCRQELAIGLSVRGVETCNNNVSLVKR